MCRFREVQCRGCASGGGRWTSLILAAVVALRLTLPAAPASASVVLDGFVPGVGTAGDVAVDGAANLAYVASAEFGLSVVDVSNPSQPAAIGGANPPFYGSRVAVSGSLAVVG